METRKICKKSTVLIVLFALSMLVLQVQAQTYSVEDSYAWSNGESYMILYDEEDGAMRHAAGQTFNASVGGYLSSFTLSVAPIGTVDVILEGRLYGTGNNLNGVNDTVLAVSTETLDSSDYTTGAYSNFTFEFAGTYDLVQYQAYAVVMMVVSGDIDDAGNELRVAIDATGSSHVGGVVEREGTTISVSAPQDAVFVVYSQDIEGMPSGTSGWTSGDTNELIDDFVSFMVPVVVMLLPAILFIIFFKRTDKWLILIGLAIGVGLGYYFGMIPVWLVFLIGIGLIGFAYSEARRNG